MKLKFAHNALVAQLILALAVMVPSLCHAQEAERDTVVCNDELVVDSAFVRILSNNTKTSDLWLSRASYLAVDPEDKLMLYCMQCCINVANGKREGVRDTLVSIVRHFERQLQDEQSERRLATALCALGYVESVTQANPSDRLFKRAERLARKTDSALLPLVCAHYRANQYMRQGRYVEAAYCARNMLARCGEAGKPGMRFWARLTMLRVYSRINVEAAVRECAEQIDREAFHVGRNSYLAAYHYALAEDHYRNGRFEDAYSHSGKSKTFATRDADVALSTMWRISLLRAKILIECDMLEMAQAEIDFCRKNIKVIAPEVCDADYSHHALELIEVKLALAKGQDAKAKRLFAGIAMPDYALRNVPLATYFYELKEILSCRAGDYATARQALDARNRLLHEAQAEHTRIRAKDAEIAFREDTTVLRKRLELIESKEEIKDMRRELEAWVGGAFGLIVIVAVVILWRVRGRHERRQKYEAKLNIQLQEEVQKHTEENERQNNLIRARNLDIIASQSYASRMQRGLMPRMKQLRHLGAADSFLIMGSSDATLGSFYTFRKIGDKLVICCASSGWTGVPGAMMTMVGISLFNDAVAASANLDSAASILMTVDSGLMSQMPDSNKRKNMAMSVAIVDMANRKLCFASARQGACLAQQGVVRILEATDARVGEGLARQFVTDEVLDYSSGDSLFLFGRGTFHSVGTDGKMLGFGRMCAMVSKAALLPSNLFRDSLVNELREWRGGRPLTDDILIMGITLA